jgi:formylglycine-generating enzyme required for sulfatase activity
MTYMRAEQTPLVGREGEGEFVFVTGTPAGKAPAPESAPVATPPAETAERGPVDPATLPAKPGMLERFKGYFARKPAEPAPPAEITGPHGAPMVLVPAGKFKMGSAIGVYTPVHKVTISRAFYLDKYEVSFARYDRFCEATGRPTPEDAGWGRGNQPVMNVTSVDADAYVRHYGMRLPTEAEWEYAARAGSAGRWSWGDDEKRVDEFIWYGANSGGRAHPVGTKSPNAWGLFDMEGNVAEWVSDWYANDYDKTRPARDPEGPPGPRSRRMHRGGSWHEEEPPGVATGGGDEPELRLQVLGFRCALPVR